MSKKKKVNDLQKKMPLFNTDKKSPPHPVGAPAKEMGEGSMSVKTLVEGKTN